MTEGSKLDRTLRRIRTMDGHRLRSRVGAHGTETVPGECILLSHEQRFRRVVRALLKAGLPATPSFIQFCIYRDPSYTGTRRRSRLNGRECKWRAEELLAAGWVKHDGTGRWVRA